LFSSYKKIIGYYYSSYVLLVLYVLPQQLGNRAAEPVLDLHDDGEFLMLNEPRNRLLPSPTSMIPSMMALHISDIFIKIISNF
jgi:hypothetical protein